jgi:hypothetical protein
MGSVSSGVCIGSFLFAPKRPHINGSVSDADDVHPPSHVIHPNPIAAANSSMAQPLLMAIPLGTCGASQMQADKMRNRSSVISNS